MSRALQELRRYTSALLAEETPQTTLVSFERARPTLTLRSARFALPTMVFLVFGNIGLVATADSAVPGDTLYPVDRAYESIAEFLGIDTGAPEERLSEASVLLAEGNFSVAVEAIADSAANTGGDIDDRIRRVGAELAVANTAAADREDLHRSVVALASTVEVIATSNADPAAWMEAIDASSQAVIDVVEGLPFEASGPTESFVPPGQDDRFAPPGLENGSTPPGQNEDIVQPGQESGRVPPGQGNRGNSP